MVKRPNQKSYKQRLKDEGWTRPDIWLPPGILEQLKAVSEQQGDSSIGRTIARLLVEASQPKVTGASIARNLHAQAGGDFEAAAELLLDYMRQRYPGFIATAKRKGPDMVEYNRIRKSLHTLKAGK